MVEEWQMEVVLEEVEMVRGELEEKGLEGETDGAVGLDGAEGEAEVEVAEVVVGIVVVVVVVGCAPLAQEEVTE